MDEASTQPSTVEQSGVLRWHGPLRLLHGGVIPDARLAWKLTGAADKPLIVVLGGISAGREVFDARGRCSVRPGGAWWSEVVGPLRALDSNQVRILGIDYLGSSGESSGPAAGEEYPPVSTVDQARALLKLLDHLGLDRIHGIVGASYGGMVALAFARLYPQRAGQLMVISATDRAHPMATAWRSIQRRAVRLGISAGRTADGMSLARSLAMTTYRSPEEFAQRFGNCDGADTDGLEPGLEGRIEAGWSRDAAPFAVAQYLLARGEDYARHFRPESFLCLSDSIDRHVVSCESLATPVMLVGVREDRLVPIDEVRAFARRLPNGRLRELSSVHGHDAFLKEADALSPLFKEFLQ